MIDFTTKKIDSSNFPPTGVPNCMYMRKVDNEYFEVRMATKTGDNLLKFACGDKMVVYSSLIVTGDTAAKFDTTVTLDLHVLNEGITSYDVSVNSGPVSNITGNTFDVTMSHNPGDIMTVMFIPKDDIGTNFHPVTYSILVTNGPPINSGLTVSGPITCELTKSIDLTLNNYISDITKFEYRVGVSSWMTIDPAQPSPKTITITPNGMVGQTIPVEFRPLSDTGDEYLPVMHNVLLTELLPIDSGANLTGDAVAPQNLPYDLTIGTNNSNILGYDVNTDTNPSYEWHITNKNDSWVWDINNIPVGTVVTVTAHPFDGSNNPVQPYNDVVHTFTVAAPEVTDSGVTLSGANEANSGEPYVLGITNSNTDISSYRILWNGDDQGIITNNPNEWIKQNVDEVVGDSVTITVVPLSNTKAVYNPLTKDISILARLPEKAGIDFSHDNEYGLHNNFREEILTANMNPKVDNIHITYQGTNIADQAPTTHVWTKYVNLPVGTIVTIVHQPVSNDPNYNFKSVTTTYVVTNPDALEVDINAQYEETVYPGATNTFTWANPADATSTKVYVDGVYKTTVNGVNGTYTTPPSSNTPGYIHTVTFEPISSTDLLYQPVDEDYVVSNPPEPVDSGITWSTNPEAEEGADIVFTRNGTCNDLDEVDVYVEGVFVITLPNTATTWTYNNTTYVEGDIVDFVFKATSVLPNRTFNIEDETVLIIAGGGLSSTLLNKTGVDNTVPYGTVYWNFDITGCTIDKVDITGNEIDNLTNVNPTNVAIHVNSNVAIGTTIQVCAVARCTNGDETSPIKCWPLLINNYTFNVPNITAPDSTVVDIPKDQTLTWNAPNVTPTSYDSLKQVVEVSTVNNFTNAATISTYYFPVTNGTSPVHDLPTALGELNLDKLLPETGDIYIRSKYVATENGTEYSGSWGNIRHFNIVAGPAGFQCLGANSEQDSLDHMTATLKYATLHVDFNTFFDGCQVIFQLADKYGDGNTGKFERSSTQGPFQSMYPEPIPVGPGTTFPWDFSAGTNAHGRIVPLKGDTVLIMSYGNTKIAAVDISNHIGQAGFANNRDLDTTTIDIVESTGGGEHYELHKIGPNDDEFMITQEWSTNNDSDTTWRCIVGKLDSTNNIIQFVGQLTLMDFPVNDGPMYTEADPVKGYILAVEALDNDGLDPSGTPPYDFWADTGKFHFYKRNGNWWADKVVLTIPKTIQTGTCGFMKDGMFVHIDENSFMRVYDLDQWDFNAGVADAPIQTMQIVSQTLTYINTNHMNSNQRTTGGILTMDANHSNIFTYTEPQSTGNYYIFEIDTTARTVTQLGTTNRTSITPGSKVNSLAIIPSGTEFECIVHDSNWDGVACCDDNNNFGATPNFRVTHYY